jgi:hypothetical protein
VAVEERAALLVVEPRNNIVWRAGPSGLKVQLTQSIIFPFRVDLAAQVVNAEGEVLPDPPYMPPQHDFAYRYFRYSQAAENVVDCYRNMFLALESLLDYVKPKVSGEGETDWIKGALIAAVAHHGVRLDAFAKPSSSDHVQDFLDAHYSAVRCAVFHSKSSTGDALRPGSLADEERIFRQLVALQAIVEGLLKTLFAVNLTTSGVTYGGFSSILEEVASRSRFLISVAECPTIEEIMAGHIDEQCNGLAPVRFEGTSATSEGEWLLGSDIKPADLPFSKVGGLRLVVAPSDAFPYNIYTAKLNGSGMTTDIELEDVIKLVVQVRCILRNEQSPKRQFSN